MHRSPVYCARSNVFVGRKCEKAEKHFSALWTRDTSNSCKAAFCGMQEQLDKAALTYRVYVHDAKIGLHGMDSL